MKPLHAAFEDRPEADAAVVGCFQQARGFAFEVEDAGGPARHADEVSGFELAIAVLGVLFAGGDVKTQRLAIAPDAKGQRIAFGVAGGLVQFFEVENRCTVDRNHHIARFHPRLFSSGIQRKA